MDPETIHGIKILCALAFLAILAWVATSGGSNTKGR